MHYSAKRGTEIACRLSGLTENGGPENAIICTRYTHKTVTVCLSDSDVGGSGSHKLEVFETNCTDN